jgi:hypothetical protein
MTLREERRLKTFEGRILRKIFVTKRNEPIGGWIKLHNDYLHNLYTSPSIIKIIRSRRMRWEVECTGEGRRRRRIVKFYKETLRYFHYSPDIIRVIKPVKAGFVGHATS